MDSPLLELSGIRFTYPGPGRTVLDGVDFSLGPNTRAGIIGPNGSGKTTMLLTAVGLIRPDSGQVRHKGRIAEDEKSFREVRRGVGYLFQNADDQLFSPTVLEDVAFGPLNLGFSAQRAREKSEQVLQSLGLDGYGPRITHKLSGGEKRLVSLATVLAMEPEVLLLDEPTTGLDPETRERLIEILNGLDKALVVVSHDWDFLDQTTTEVWAMQAGRLEKAEREVLHEHVHAHPHGHLPHRHDG